ncbi:hydrogenase [Pseudomonas sp. GCM10022186]|uniref:hydrogenase n=1 Tax=Pseudomonas sp. GCM10022186 TaxID=3252650 RepID=UPI003610A5DF
MNEARRRLLCNGMFLFLLGLVTGLAEAQFTNPRMGLAAHLEGIMNGMLLLAIGAAWTEVCLGSSARSLAYWTLLYGAYANWLFTTLAAVMGTAALSPVTGAGYEAEPWQESLVTLGFASVGISMIVAALLLLWGFRPRAG